LHVASNEMRRRRAALCMVGLSAIAGAAFAGCDGSQPATADFSTLLAPSQGQATGSVWSPRAAPNPLRPQFRWSPVAGAAGYEIQIDDSCLSPVPGGCTFPTPEIDAQTTDSAFVPSADLPVSMTPPVGRRYMWRVRSCDTSGACGLWSRTNYVDVGRQRQDFNGDGYADLAVAAGGSNPNAVFVYFGGPALPVSAGWTIRGDTSASPLGGSGFSRLRWLGDLNGDGFADLAVGVERESGDSVRVYFGGTSPATDPALEIADSASTGSSLWTLLASDLNGDGAADLFQAYWGDPSGTYVVSYGPFLGEGSAQTFINDPTVVATCDFDSDGYADLVTSNDHLLRGGPNGPFGGSGSEPISAGGAEGAIACAWNVNGLGGANLLVDLGTTAARLQLQSSPTNPGAQACDGPLPALSPGPSGYGQGHPNGDAVADVGDADGDGYDDLLVGDFRNNRAALFFGGCPATRVSELPGLSDLGGNPSAGGAVAAAGDLDGDGFPDLAVANVYGNFDSICSGEVYLYRGGVVVDTTPTSVLLDPDSPPPAGGCRGDAFGLALD
jgi:hypothetical protein